MIGRLLIILLLTLITSAAWAQDEDLMKQDSVKQQILKNGKTGPGDTLKVTSDAPVKEIPTYAKRFNPRKATLYAAILPGLGQVYTKKYWKVPLVYTGFGFLIYAVSFSEQQYTLYKHQLFQTINDPAYVAPSGYLQPQLRTIVDAYRRQRDYFLIINFFLYMLQMVDAHVDAHLKEFDLNPALQVKLESVPIQNSAAPNSLSGQSTGIGIVFKFK